MQMRYRGGRAIVVTGPVTGKRYQFSGTARVQLVDPRDAIVIARDPSFRVEGVVELSMMNSSLSPQAGRRDA